MKIIMMMQLLLNYYITNPEGTLKAFGWMLVMVPSLLSQMMRERLAF